MLFVLAQISANGVRKIILIQKLNKIIFLAPLAKTHLILTSFFLKTTIIFTRLENLLDLRIVRYFGWKQDKEI